MGTTMPQLQQVVFCLPGIGVVQYAQAQVWYLTRLVCLVFIVVAWALVWRRAVTVRQLLLGAAACATVIASGAAAAYWLWRAVPGSHPFAPWLPALAATLPLPCLALYAMRGRLRGAIGLRGTVLGAMLVMLVMLLAASMAAPGFSYLLAWPLLGALLAFGALHAPGAAALPQHARGAVVAAGLTPSVLLILPVAWALLAQLGAQATA